MKEFFRAKLPRPISHALRAGLVTVALVGCSDKGANTPKNNNDNIIDQPTAAEKAKNPNGFLDLPFPNDSKMQVRQGWADISAGGELHKGIDYIKGEIDQSPSWQSFPVLASADGEACKNPRRTIGSAVFIKHEFDGKTFYTYYGHVVSIDPGIPECNSANRKEVKRGQKIADAGDIGSPGLIHVHFQSNLGDESVDPYGIAQELEKRGIKATKDHYPDPNFTNGKFCGPRTLWRNCPVGKVLGERVEATPIATVTPIAKVATVEAKSPTLAPVRKATATPTERKSEYPVGKGRLVVRLEYADGTPLKNSYIVKFYKQEKDSDGKLVSGKYIEGGWSSGYRSDDKLGNGAEVVAEPGNYIVTFPYILGPALDKSHDGSGVGGLIIKEGETNLVSIRMGRVLLRLYDGNGKPLGVGLCADVLKSLGSAIRGSCIESDGTMRAVLNMMPGEYELSYRRGLFTGIIGKFSVTNGQTLDFTCTFKEPRILQNFIDPNCNAQ